MSTADSQMLAAASSVSQNILQEFGHRKLSEKQSLFAARLTIICVSVVGVVLARDPDSSVFGIYELLPAFLVSLAVCAVVSLVTPAPTEDILAEFDAAK